MDNRITATDWRKSSYSTSNGGNCVEVADAPGNVLVRDTTDRTGPMLRFGPGAWRTFADRVKRSLAGSKPSMQGHPPRLGGAPPAVQGRFRVAAAARRARYAAPARLPFAHSTVISGTGTVVLCTFPRSFLAARSRCTFCTFHGHPYGQQPATPCTGHGH